MPGPEPLPFGTQLRRMRIAAALSQEALAERAGISARAVGDLERSVHHAPRLETVRLLADALGLDAQDRAALLAAARPELPTDPPSPERPPMRTVLTPFLGRVAEVAAIVALMRAPATRLMTLTGPGGVGKTRLAVQAGQELAGDSPHGTVFVDLAPLQDPALVLPTVATALGVREIAGRPMAEVVSAFLSEQSILLILDNFEHLVEAAPVVTDLLTDAPLVKVLVTSRAPLRLRGEHEYPVPPLPLPETRDTGELDTIVTNEAVAFFTAHARYARPDFSLTSETVLPVVGICQHLDGLPLALELAAARIKVLPPVALLARLEQRLPLLTGGARDAPARQRTLRDTIGWSYDLLTPDEQTLLRRLAVFAGGWTLEAAETSVDPEEAADVLDRLSSLVDKSLVRLNDQESEPRYGMLETIREFALNQLAANPDEVRAARQAHAAYFAARLLVPWHEPQLVQVDWVPDEQDNLRTMLSWLLETGDVDSAMHAATCLGQYWTFRGGHFSESRAWLERALQQGPHASLAARVEAMHGIAFNAVYQGDLATARAVSSQGLDLARHAGDAVSFLNACAMAIEVARLEGHLAEALALAQEALAMARTLDDPVRLGWPLQWLGRTLRSSGDLVGAEALQHEAATTFHSAGFPWGESDAFGELALIARDRGDASQAFTRFAKTLRLRHEIGANIGIASGLVGIADLARRAGALDEAARLFGAASAHVDRYGYTPLPRSRALHGLSLDEVREAIGAERFAQGWDAGRMLTTDQAVTEAIALAKVCGGDGESD